MSLTTISIKPYSCLLKLPETLFAEIINKYCTSDDIDAIGKALLNLQKTDPSLYKAMKNFWITKIAQLNLSVIASKNIIIKDNGKAFKITELRTIFSTEKPKTFYANKETTKTKNGIKYLKNPEEYYNNQKLSVKVKKSILQTNRNFLDHFCEKSLHLSNPETVLFLSNIFSQLSEKRRSLLTSEITSIANFENKALDLIISSTKSNDSQLFYFLYEHRKWCSRFIDVKDPSSQNNHLSYQKFNNFLFFYATQYRMTNVVKIILKTSTINQESKAVDVNILSSPEAFPDDWIRTIWESLRQGKTALKVAIEAILLTKSTDLSLINTLLANGANPNLKAHNGTPPLATALIHGSNGQDSIRIKIIKSLLAAKANIDEVNHLGETPLLWAIRCSSAKVFKFFLNQNPNIQLSSFLGHTALIKAAQSPNCINKLRLLSTPRKLMLILNGKKSSKRIICSKWTNHTDFQGNTALMHAVRSQYLHIETYVKILLNAKADISLVNKTGKTALKIAVERSLPESVISLLTESPSHHNKGKKRRRD